jgi:hypothetical protein
VCVDLWNRWCWKTSELFPLQSVRFVDVQTYVPKNVDMVLDNLYGRTFLIPQRGRKFSPQLDANGLANLYRGE